MSVTSSPTKNILITGLPGVGKTTLIRRLAVALREYCPVGFYTGEIREGSVRKGFELTSLDGQKGILSHVNIGGAYRVGKYEVDIKGFEGFLDTLSLSGKASRLVIIDEIGKMELFSGKFRRLIEEILDSERVLIASIALKGGEIIDAIKKRLDVRLFELKQSNRDSLFTSILKETASRMSGRVKEF